MKTWIEIRPVEVTAGLARRAAERAAWRAIVREKLGDDIAVEYNGNGAPVLLPAPGPATPPGCIGVSHTRGWVAVVWSPGPCAIDIEPKSRPLSPAAAERYGFTTMEEWCAFEAEYKYEGLAGHPPARGSVRFEPHDQLIVAVISDTETATVPTK
jgi:hypothetical protein